MSGVAKWQAPLPPWLNWWMRELANNVKEVPGSPSAGRIIEYHSHTTLRATSDEIPWCSAAMCCAMHECGLSSTQSAAARSWLGFGIRLKSFQLGAIAIFERGAPESLSGHVAIALSEDNGVVTCIGGNQSNAVAVAKYPKSKLIAYMWPADFNLAKYYGGAT